VVRGGKMKLTYKIIFLILLLSFSLPNIGGHLNEYAEHQNGNKMPVWCLTSYITTIVDYTDSRKTHTHLTRNTNDIIITDIIPIILVSRYGVYIDNVMSIGDVFIFVGYLLNFVGLILLPSYTIFVIWRFLKVARKPN
jgi:hypothetical protein